MLTMALSLAATLFPYNYSVSGQGSLSCATAFSDQNEPYTEQWIGGFISGVNSTRGGRVGLTTDLAGLMAETKIFCEREPSKTLTWATQQAYVKLLSS